MIRAASVDDAASIADLEARSAFHPWSASSLRSTLDARTTRAFLDTLDSGPRGYVLASCVADEGEILTIGVDPGHRRQGIARALLAAVYATWRAEGVTSGFLEVRASNSGARALYRTEGWEEVGRRAGYYGAGEDAVLMRWTP